MKRWHQEQHVMFKRWRVEMDNHGYDWREPPTDPNACHCAKGIGSMRKQTPFGHHRHCLLCNWSKYMEGKNRSAKKRQAIEDSLY